MQIEKISYINSIPSNSKAKKSFYKNDESEDAITFSSELTKENDDKSNSNDNEKSTKDSNNNTDLARDTNMNLLTEENSKKNSEKLNIII